MHRNAYYTGKDRGRRKEKNRDNRQTYTKTHTSVGDFERSNRSTDLLGDGLLNIKYPTKYSEDMVILSLYSDQWR